MFYGVLNETALLKIKKKISKVILLSNKLRNMFLKKKNFRGAIFNKQLKLCVSLVSKAARNYYENLD